MKRRLTYKVIYHIVIVVFYLVVGIGLILMKNAGENAAISNKLVGGIIIAYGLFRGFRSWKRLSETNTDINDQ